ncbi:unnamed protein product [Tenebrio molitor]|nr:unnamed protein product [Tenebrio molitor]
MVARSHTQQEDHNFFYIRSGMGTLPSKFLFSLIVSFCKFVRTNAPCILCLGPSTFVLTIA